MTTTILNAAQADKLIVSIKGRGAKLDADIHQAALSVVSHHVEHGDVTLINRLVLAMPKSSRRNALVAWVLHFDARTILNDDKASRDDTPILHVKSTLPFELENADATPFWDFKAKEGVAIWSFDTWIVAQTKALNGALGKATDDVQKAKITAAITALTA